MNGCFLRVRSNNRNSKICAMDGQAGDIFIQIELRTLYLMSLLM